MKRAITETNSEQIKKKKKVFKAFDNLRYQKTGWVFGFQDCKNREVLYLPNLPRVKVKQLRKVSAKREKDKNHSKDKDKGRDKDR